VRRLARDGDGLDLEQRPLERLESVAAVHHGRASTRFEVALRPRFGERGERNVLRSPISTRRLGYAYLLVNLNFYCRT
jgi:hypothetical protein